MGLTDTTFTPSSVSRRPEALAIALQLPWYRSLWLSSVTDIAVSVDGRDVPRESLVFELAGAAYSIEDLPKQWETLWFIQDRGVVVVPDQLVGPQPEHDVTVALDLRLPYMQIAPQTYVRNYVVTSHRVNLEGVAP